MPAAISILPAPTLSIAGPGHFLLTASTPIGSDSFLGAEAIRWFQSAFYELSGVALLRNDAPMGSAIRLKLMSDLGPESYHLNVEPNSITVGASDERGFLYALVSLLQCIPLDAPVDAGIWQVSQLLVNDAPRFSWRGLMLDSSRYFQPVAWIKKFLDVMLLHKFNVLHWHLTDDQGWRVEIERYPALTSVSAWRRETRVGHEIGGSEADFDGRPHGGFYCKAQLKEIVAYAEERGITIVPEIEMPGHAQEVLAAYPQLACTDGPFEVSTHWGIHSEVFCAGNDQVFRFLEHVLEEVLEVFPSEFIHIGGDECPKTRWKACPKCQKRIQDEGLADEGELQSWFIRHFDTFLRDRGRRLIGWDEILEGGLAQNATVMSWRGEKGGIAAAQAGHDVVMTPSQYVYLDYYQSANLHAEPLTIGGRVTLRQIYDYEPIPSALDAVAASHVLGGQGNLWTEYMPRPENVEYMAFPRACALAERLWSSQETRDYTDFTARLKIYLQLLDRLQVNYRQPGAREGF